MSRPLTPAEIEGERAATFPSAVWDAFNAEIAQRLTDGVAVVPQSAVVERLTNAGFKASEIYSRGWLNVEKAYARSGWQVTYEKPDYTGADGPARFTFRAAHREGASHE